MSPKDELADPFTILRPRLEKALIGFTRDFPAWSAQPPTQTAKPDRSEFPLPELVLFALRNVLGFHHSGHGEKIRWAVSFGFNGAPVSLEMAKFGFRIYAAETVDIKRVCGQLQVAAKHVEKWLAPFATRQCALGNVTVANRYSEFDSRYRFFRGHADRAYRMASRKPSTKPAQKRSNDIKKGLLVITEGFNQTMRARTRGFYYSTAMVDAYYSRLEHMLVLLRAFTGNPLQEGELNAFLSDTWDDKLKSLVDVEIPATQKLYSDLKRIKERVRNPFAHGGVENDGGSLYVHIPTVGALPANFTQIRNSVRFNFIPVDLDDHGAACSVFDAFDQSLRFGALASAYRLVEASVDPAFASDSLAMYKKLRGVSAEELEAWIDQWSYRRDQHDNMDY